MKKEQVNPPHEQLLAVSVGGEVITRDFEVQDMGAVPLNERYIYLTNVLKMFDRVVELDYIARQNPIPRNSDNNFVPNRQQAISRNSANAAEQLRLESRAEFYKAYGTVALEVSGTQSKEDIEKEASKNYDWFTMRFAGHHKRDNRRKARHHWDGILNPATIVEPDKDEIEKQPGLSTREKLIILAEADDAGFLPTTNEEKSMVITYLDYIKNQAFELETQNQLVEVGNFHGKHHDYSTAKEYALQAGRSIAFEFADWFSQASEQLEDLKVVDQLFQETVNPDLSLAYALHVDMLKAVPLIRFMDLVELRATGKVEYKTEKGLVKLPFAPLRTRRNEDSDMLIPGKNKVLEDPYTGTRSKTTTDWLKARMMQIRVGDVRNLITEAISDQENRVGFHRLVLEDLATEKTDSEMLREASKVARDILEKAS